MRHQEASRSYQYSKSSWAFGRFWLYNGWIIILLRSLSFHAKILCPVAFLLWIVPYNSSYPINIRHLIYGWRTISQFSQWNLWGQIRFYLGLHALASAVFERAACITLRRSRGVHAKLLSWSKGRFLKTIKLVYGLKKKVPTSTNIKVEVSDTPRTLIGIQTSNSWHVVLARFGFWDQCSSEFKHQIHDML